MGLPLEPPTLPPYFQGMSCEAMDAPLRLATESYETFAAQLHVAAPDSSDLPAVADELRRLQIDPEVFYRNAKRLGLRRLSPDDLDLVEAAPALAEGASPVGGATAGSAIASLAGPSSDTAVSAAAAAAVPSTARSNHRAEKAGSLAFDPPARSPLEDEQQPDNESTGEPAGPVPPMAALLPGLNVPQHDDIEDMPYEELSLSETRGGRMGHGTPRDLSGKLQIDSLTDDEDDEVFREAAHTEREQANEGDEIEAFSLDPDFDYDNVENLSRRV